MERQRLLIIDANSLIHRAYHALPPLSTSKGEKIWVVYGFLLVFLKALKEFKPSFVVAAFDLPGPTFRHKEFKDYKSQRAKAPEDLYSQIPRVKEALKSFNVPVFEKEDFEADDIIGAIAKNVSEADKEVENIIISGDLDSLQLVDQNTKVYALKKGLKDTILYDKERVKERYNILPSQLVDFKALRGDPSDNIPGVNGIGEKTALQLIQKFGSLEKLYQEIESKNERARNLKGKLQEKLLLGKEQAFLSKMLVQIRRDIKIDFELKKCQWNYDREKVARFFRELEFNTLLKRI